MALNKTKLEEYANKVYRGDLRRFKEKQKKDASYTFNVFFTKESKATKGKRVAPSSSVGEKVVDDCKRKCVICGKEYDKDPGDFEIHHVNGDRSKTATDNLVLLCLSCHKKVHRHARAKLQDYKVKRESSSSKKPQSPFDIPSFNPPTFDLPSFDSSFDTAPKKKGRKKKK
jgi:5-methylcytosine-specific restriction endonuclease McrA